MAQTGNQKSSNFFANANANRISLVPGAAQLTNFANKGLLGQGTATAYASRVRGSQQNGSGPAQAPTSAPFSFGQFATGLRMVATRVRPNSSKK
jgi:hypothetical protein